MSAVWNLNSDKTEKLACDPDDNFIADKLVFFFFFFLPEAD